MSARNREDRKEAVCGHKPGGKDAYYLKETCTQKGLEKKDEPANSKRRLEARLEKYDEYLKFVLKDFMLVRSRELFLRSRPAQGGPPFAGAEHAIASIFIRDAYAQRDYSVYSRIGTAVKEFNASQTAIKNKIHLTSTLERLVIMGVSNHYAGVLKALAPSWKPPRRRRQGSESAVLVDSLARAQDARLRLTQPGTRGSHTTSRTPRRRPA